MTEEPANSISHGPGLLAAIAAVPVLVGGAVRHGGAADVVGAALFGASVVLLYLASTRYPALPPCRARRVFQVPVHSRRFLRTPGA